MVNSPRLFNQENSFQFVSIKHSERGSSPFSKSPFGVFSPKTSTPKSHHRRQSSHAFQPLNGNLASPSPTKGCRLSLGSPLSSPMLSPAKSRSLKTAKNNLLSISSLIASPNTAKIQWLEVDDFSGDSLNHAESSSDCDVEQEAPSPHFSMDGYQYPSGKEETKSKIRATELLKRIQQFKGAAKISPPAPGFSMDGYQYPTSASNSSNNKVGAAELLGRLKSMRKGHSKHVPGVSMDGYSYPRGDDAVKKLGAASLLGRVQRYKKEEEKAVSPPAPGFSMDGYQYPKDTCQKVTGSALLGMVRKFVKNAQHQDMCTPRAGATSKPKRQSLPTPNCSVSPLQL